MPRGPLDRQRPTRGELIAVLAGAGLRLAFPSHMSVEHFDEGVYASSAWFGPDEGYQYPNGHLYAPPLLSRLIEWLTPFR